MKTILIMSALLLLISGNSLAGSQYDACIKKVKSLKAKEASDCSGLRYLLDPSSCFKAQRELKELDGTCAAIGAAEQVEVTAPKAVPENRVTAAPQKPAEAAPAITLPEKNGASVAPSPQKPVAPASPVQPAVSAAPAAELTCDQAKAENARLKSENSRLRTENEQLRKAVPH